MPELYDIAVIGSGPAGMTAGIYASRALLNTIIFEKNAYGGLMALTDKLENWPGEKSIAGYELAEKMHAQALDLGCKFVSEEVQKVEKNGEKLFSIKTASGSEFSAKTVIYAAGSVPRKAEIPGEKEFTGSGVSYCAVCDGAFYRGLKVAVLGGGDSALKEALYLTKFAEKVTIIHRRDEFRAEKITQNEVRSNPKIDFILNSVAERIEGKDFVEKIVVKDVKTGGLSELAVDGVFIFLGYIPETKPVEDLVKLAESGHILTDSECRTSTEGLFAAGDIREKLVRQVSTAVGDGAIAAVAAEHYLSE
ncbi:thioredoxin-disulfide reductase [bacterium]|nr:thioredoxin-disulfide reductase [bacterium]